MRIQEQVVRDWRALNQLPTLAHLINHREIVGDEDLPLRLPIPSPFTVLFGANGVGKSRALAALTAGEAAPVLIKVPQLVHYLLEDFGKRTDLLELAEEVEAYPPVAASMELVSAVVRRDYGAVLWHDIDLADSPFADITGDESVPLFTVEHRGRTYDFRSMGMGELSAHVLAWCLSRARSDATILLLDEPDAFVPSLVSVSAAHALLNFARSRSLPVVMTTHSLELVETALAANSGVLMVDDQPRATAIGPSLELDAAAAAAYGRSHKPSLVAFVEDEAASHVLDRAIHDLNPKLWRILTIVWGNGWGNILTTWRNLPRPPQLQAAAFLFVGDGDKETDIDRLLESPDPRRWPIGALPCDPDEGFKATAHLEVDYLASVFGVEPAAMLTAIRGAAGLEAHAWTAEVVSHGRALHGTKIAALASVLIRHLDAIDSNLENLRRAVRELPPELSS